MKRIVIAILFLSSFRADAMSVIRRLTNSVPPVATNAPPVVTNTPPVVIASNVTWGVNEIKRWGKPMKVMIAKATSRGLVASIYDRESRKKSEIHELHNGTWSRVWSGVDETIGAEVLPQYATVYGDDIYFAAERGDTFLVYSQTSGKVRRGAKVPSGYKWNVFTAEWKGIPVVGGDGPDTKASVFDMRDGKKLFQSALNGLIAGMAEDDQGVLWLAISDGEHGVCNSEGWSNLDIKPSSIACIPEIGVLAGSQVDGKVYRWAKSKWVEVADLDCSKINRMNYIPEYGLVISGAKPDTFATLNPKNMTVTRIARFEDEKKDSTGEQFDTEASAWPGVGLVLGRANGSGCYLYEAKPSTVQDVSPVPPVIQPSKFDITSARWLNRSGAGFREVASLKTYWGNFGSKRGIYMEIGPGMKGENCHAGVLIQRDILYAGAWDAIGDGTGRKFKGTTNLGYQNDKGGPYIAGTDSALRRKLMPQDNEELGIFCYCSDTGERSAVSVILWQPEAK